MSTSALPKRSSGGHEAAQRVLAAATAASIILAFIPGADIVTYPIRLFSTIIHEGGHAAAALITQGQVDHIAIDPSGSGVTGTIGGWRWLILFSGYLGVTLFGAVGLLLNRQHNGGRNVLVMMGGLVAVITLFWIHATSNLFGFAAGLGIAGLLFLAAYALREPHARFLASFLAVQLCLNALFDIRALLHLTFQTSAANDAVFMSREYGLAPWFWASLWAIGAVLILGASLRAYWRGKWK